MQKRLQQGTPQNYFCYLLDFVFTMRHSFVSLVSTGLFVIVIVICNNLIINRHQFLIGIVTPTNLHWWGWNSCRVPDNLTPWLMNHRWAAFWFITWDTTSIAGTILTRWLVMLRRAITSIASLAT
jgi:hypothetical protein